MIKIKDGYAKLIGTNPAGSANRVLLSNGGDIGQAVYSEANTLVRRNDLGQICSNVTTNTAPFIVNSNTLVKNLNVDLLDGMSAGDFARGGYVSYTSVSNPNNLTSGWYTLCTVSDSYTPVTLIAIKTYAHCSMLVSINKGFKNKGSVTILNYVDNANSDYYNIKGVRLLSDGQVQINLVRSNNTLVNIDASCLNNGNNPNWASSLIVDETSYPTDSVSIIDTKMGIHSYINTSGINTQRITSPTALSIVTTDLTSIYLRYNNDDTKSIMLLDSALCPTGASKEKINLGLISQRWKGIYSVTGDYTGPVWIQNSTGTSTLNAFSTYNTDSYLRLGRQASKNNCSELNFYYSGDNANENYLKLGFYSNLSSYLKGTTAGDWLLSGKLTVKGSNIFLHTSDSTLKIYDGKLKDGYSDGNIQLQTSIDGTDGETSSYPVNYPGRCNLVLQPRGGQVYVGLNPEGGDTRYKLYVNGAIYGTNFAGNSDTATKLLNARKIGLVNGVEAVSTSFDGTKDIQIPVTKIYESYIAWGNTSISNGVSPIDNGMHEFDMNRLSFMRAEDIIIEYSNDGGVTWNLTPYSDIEKQSIVTSFRGKRTYLGNNDTNQQSSDRLRITITASYGHLYIDLKKILIYMSQNGALDCKVTLEKSYCGSDTTFNTVGSYKLVGWSAWNSIPLQAAFGGSDGQTGNIRRLRFTFSFEGMYSGYETKTNMYVDRIHMYGSISWSTPHTMSYTGNLYSFDMYQHATFPASITSTGFLKKGSSDQYVLLGGGGHSTISNLLGNNYWKVNAPTTVGGGDIYLELWRGDNASWKIINTSGKLKFQNNYTTTVTDYFDAFVLEYNTGNAYFKGNVGIKVQNPTSSLHVSGNSLIEGNSYPLLTLKRTDSTNGALIAFNNTNGRLGYIGMKGNVNSGLYRYSDDAAQTYLILDTANSSVSGGGSSWGSSITVNIGGVSKTLTIPSNPNVNTWRAILVNGNQLAGTGTNTYALNFVAGEGITIDKTSGTSSAANKINITNAGVRSVTIDGNQLKVDTNGNVDNYTIPYADIANQLAESFILKINTGTTEGTNLYTYNGSSAKTLNIKAGSNITLSTTSGNLTIASSYVNTTYSLSGNLSGNTFVTTLTPSSGTSTTATIPAMSGATSSAAGKAGLVPAPGVNKNNHFLRGDGTWVVPNDTKVTSVDNHYTPSASTNAALEANASSTTSATWGSTDLVTGVKISRDAKGHITGISVNSIQMPSNPNTHYTTKIYAGASGTAQNSEATNPYLKITDDDNYRNQVRLLGSGGTTVSSNAYGTITISSPSSLKNPNALTVKYNISKLFDYDGSEAKTLSIKAGSNVTIEGDTTNGNIIINATDTNTTYSAGTGLSLIGTTFSLKTTSAGSATKGIYLSSGTFSPMTYSLYATVNEGTADKLAYYSGDNTISAYSSTIGSDTKPMYLKTGIPTACAGTVGNGTNPIYMNNGTITASNSTVGSGVTPVYMNAGTITACSVPMVRYWAVYQVFIGSGSGCTITKKAGNHNFISSYSREAAGRALITASYPSSWSENTTFIFGNGSVSNTSDYTKPCILTVQKEHNSLRLIVSDDSSVEDRASYAWLYFLCIG